MRTVAIHQPEHFPWLGFLDKARKADRLFLLDTVAFKKNYFDNRNRIRTPQGWAWVTVPVLLKGKSGQVFTEVEINRQARWAEVYFRTLHQNYAKSPYWAEFSGPLEEIIQRPWERLVDLNLALIRFLWEAFRIPTPLQRTSEMQLDGSRSELLLEICRTAGATTYLSGRMGKDYLDEAIFTAAGIAVEYQEFQHPTYRQVFSPFVPGLSGLDLLLNEGREGIRLLDS